MRCLAFAALLLTLPVTAQTSPPATANQAPAASPAQPTPTPHPAGEPALQPPPQMLPGEAYSYAMQPYTEARQQPDDLTDADRWALGITISRAREECGRLAPLKEESEELLSMGRLCVLGQDYEEARVALVAYLGMPVAKAREEARLLLARAFLGLDQVAPAESQMQSLMAEYPYDASIHWGIDLVIESAEGRDSGYDEVVRRLNEQQLPFILDTLRGPGSLTKNGQISSVILFRDALRIALQLRQDGRQKEADDLIGQLSLLAGDPKFAATASYPAVQSAFDRYALAGKPAPVAVLHGKVFTRAGTLMPRNLALKGSPKIPGAPKILVAFTLWAPSTSEMLGKTATALTTRDSPKADSRQATPEKKTTQRATAAATPIYAITSFAANPGGEDHPSPEVLASLRAFPAGLPAGVTLVIVPDEALKRFAFDSYPGGVALDAHGVIRFSDMLTPGGVRLMVRALRPAP